MPAAPAPLRVAPAALRRLLARQCGHAPPWLADEIARRMGERLPLVRLQPDHLIDWWGGAGAGDRLLAQQYPRARRVVVAPVEGAARWLPAAPPWQRLNPWDASWRRRLVAETEVAAQPRAQLVWANMMLHWVDDIATLLARWHAALQPEGFVMFSCFGPDTLRQLREVYAACGWGEPASTFTDLHDIGDALVHAGFADPVMDMEMLQLHWSSAPALLAELRTLGGNTAPQRFAGLRTPRWRARLEAELAGRLGGSDGRIGLRFEIVYGHAFRPAARAAAGALTQIPLSDMREMIRRRRGAEPTPGSRGGAAGARAQQVLG